MQLLGSYLNSLSRTLPDLNGRGITAARNAAQHGLAAALFTCFEAAALHGVLLCLLVVGLFSRPPVAARRAARLVDFTRHDCASPQLNH